MLYAIFPECKLTYHGGEAMKLPRIDTHDHFRDGKEAYKETIEHGLRVAASQGVGAVIDMPNTSPPILCENDVQRRLELVPETSPVKYYLLMGIVPDSDQIKHAIEYYRKYPQIVGFKMYVCQMGKLTVADVPSQLYVYSELVKQGYDGPLVVHCECEDRCKPDKWDPTNPYSHCIARPREAEIEAVKNQISNAKRTGFAGHLHIAHVSCPESVELIHEAQTDRDEYLRISCEITPHHLMFDSEYLARPDGLLYKTNPPLRNMHYVFQLHELVRQGKVNCFGTDHAPHTLGEKLYGDKNRNYPSGFPSLYLYGQLIEEFLPAIRVSKDIIHAMACENPRRIFPKIK